MKEGWSYKKLGEVATFSRGLTYSKRDEVDVSDNIVLRSNNIDLLSSKLTFTELKYLHDDFEIPQDKRVKKGSIFICMSNGSKIHLGKVAYIDKDYNYAFGGFMGQITPNKDVDGLYLHHVLMSPSYKKYIKSLSEGANINNLKFKDLSEFVVGYPSLSEQRSIVARLDAAFSHIDALKANAEKQLNEARKLFQAELTECMKPKEGWEEKKLGEVCDFEGGSQPPKSEWINHPQDGYVRMLQIRDFTKSRNAEIEYVKISKKIRLCKADDILIGRYGASVGKILTGLAGAYNVAIIKSIPNEELISKAFIKRYFEARSFQSVLFKVCASRAAQAGFSKDDICDTPIPVPPLSEQHRIVSHLDSLSSTIRKLEELQQKTLAECDALKQAMLREVFE